MSSDKQTKEDIIKVRAQYAEQDLAIIENSQKRLEGDKARLIMKLVALREELLGIQEQDE
jgi:hypothetical protein